MPGSMGTPGPGVEVPRVPVAERQAAARGWDGGSFRRQNADVPRVSEPPSQPDYMQDKSGAARDPQAVVVRIISLRHVVQACGSTAVKWF